MTKTTSFALRTFPEFRDAAKSLVRLPLYDQTESDGRKSRWPIYSNSINSAFNSLIAKGLSSVVRDVDTELLRHRAALEIVQEITLFLLNNPAAKYAHAENFSDSGSARRLLKVCAAAKQEGEENDGAIYSNLSAGLSAAEELLYQLVDDLEYGMSRTAATELLARVQASVSMLSTAKDEIQRALATWGEDGARPLAA